MTKKETNPADNAVCNQCDDYQAADKKVKCPMSPYEDGLCHG